MLSEKQLLANRQNALRSTGPRTDAGRAVSSQNAIKHGLRAENTVIPGEDHEEFEGFRRLMLDDLAPVGALEVMLTDRITAAFWKLRRAGRVETEILRGLYNKRLLHQQQVQIDLKAEIKRRQAIQDRQHQCQFPDDPAGYEKTHAAWAASQQAEMIRENRWPTGPGHPTPDEAMKDFIADYTLKLRRQRQAKQDAEIQQADISEPELGTIEHRSDPQTSDSVSLGKIIQDDITGSNILARFRLYEGQIERSLYKALTELQKLQVLRSSMWMPVQPADVSEEPAAGTRVAD